MSFLYSKFGKKLIVAEIGVLAGTYYIYHNLTIDEKYRERMDEKLPWLMTLFHEATRNTYKQLPVTGVTTMPSSANVAVAGAPAASPTAATRGGPATPGPGAGSAPARPQAAAAAECAADSPAAVETAATTAAMATKQKKCPVGLGSSGAAPVDGAPKKKCPFGFGQ